MENTRIGPFLISKRLGSNRRQKVYRATQVEQNVDVALKFIGMPPDAERSKAFKKIQIEVDLLKELDHPNLVKALGAGVEQDQIFFASELVKGESLTAALARRGKFAADQVVEFGKQIASLLDYLHTRKIIHSKLTPDKILITRDGAVKVADLRLNRSRKRRWDSPRKRELDIAAYMAPEQFKQGATANSDIYSLGVILYEMLTGKLPYEPDTMGRMAQRKMQNDAPVISDFVMNCPVWLDKTVCQMISPNPRDRPRSARAIVLAMDELKTIDQTRKSSVSQVSGNFNPLTAGADKTEADRLLGKKTSRNSNETRFPTTGLMLAGLVIIFGIFVFAMLPASNQKNLERAQSLMDSDDPGDWREARSYLKKIIAKDSDNSLYSDAEFLYFESRRRTLLVHAQRGRTIGLQSSASRRFIEAFRAQKNGDLDSARSAFLALTESVDENGDERHIYEAAKNHLEKIKLEPAIPTDIAKLFELIESQRELSKPTEVDSAVKLLSKIQSAFANRPKYEGVVEAASKLLIEHQEKTRSTDQSETTGNEN